MNLKFKIITSKICFIIILLLVIVNLWMHFYKNQPIIANENTFIHIKPGSNSGRIISQLQTQGIINSAIGLKFYLYWIDATKNLKSGDYHIIPSISHKKLIDYFTKGNQVAYKIRLEEGKPINSAINKLIKNSKISNNNNNNIWQWLHENLIKPDGFPENRASVEGLLFPDTYEFTCDTPVENILKIANEKLINILMQEWQLRANNLPYKTPYQALIIASLIEKESGVELEWRQISGVFARRLQKKMRLQADPTVIYGLEKDFDGKITKKMLATKTPYNTYLINGLPPSPIALVSKKAIYAALHPDNSDTLYFVAKGDGTHVFSAKLEDHLLAIKKYSIDRQN